MNDAKIRVIGYELNALALRFQAIADEAWTLYEDLKKELEAADPASPQGKELEKLVIGLGRCIPSGFKSIEVYNHANALMAFPLCGKKQEEPAHA